MLMLAPGIGRLVYESDTMPDSENGTAGPGVGSAIGAGAVRVGAAVGPAPHYHPIKSTALSAAHRILAVIAV